ncbi:MAG: flagellar biosynthetic protein FliO [Phycisphaerae bacterium]
MTPKTLWPIALAIAVFATAALASPAAADRAGTLWAASEVKSATDAGAQSVASPGADAPSDTDTPSDTPPEKPSEKEGNETLGRKSGEKTASPFDRKTSSEPTDLLGHSLAAVLVILVLGAAAIFVVKRLLPRLGISQGRQVRVLETVYLGPRKSLYVVQVGDRTLLVSGTRERLGLLADVTGSVPPPDETAPGTAPGTPATRFRIPGTEPENA